MHFMMLNHSLVCPLTRLRSLHRLFEDLQVKKSLVKASDQAPVERLVTTGASFRVVIITVVCKYEGGFCKLYWQKRIRGQNLFAKQLYQGLTAVAILRRFGEYICMLCHQLHLHFKLPSPTLPSRTHKAITILFPLVRHMVTHDAVSSILPPSHIVWTGRFSGKMEENKPSSFFL